MRAAPCSCRVGTKLIALSASASSSERTSSPGTPKTWFTPSFSRHFTRRSAALIAARCSLLDTLVPTRHEYHGGREHNATTLKPGCAIDTGPAPAEAGEER